LTEIFAKENNLELDLGGFNQEMEKQKKMARAKSNISTDIFSKGIIDLLPAQFMGYEASNIQAQLIQIIKSTHSTIPRIKPGDCSGLTLSGVEVSKQSVDKIKEGDEAWVVLDRTPFYGESGGQIGDMGKITCEDKKAVLEVLDTKQIDTSIVHIVKVTKGEFKVKDSVLAIVDETRRQAIKRSHTATHLLQAALRKVLGEHVQQSGSLVEPDYLRFDFTHFKDLKDQELEKIQDIINENILSNEKVNVDTLDKDKALNSGAIALFGEKYGEKVRVVSIGKISKEFCGGTHLDYTAGIGIMFIGSESSIGSGLRRIEAFTGKLAYEKLKNNSGIVKNLSQSLKSRIEDLAGEVDSLISKNKKLEKEINVFAQNNINSQVEDILKKEKKSVSGKEYIVYFFENLGIDVLRKASDLFLAKLAKKSVVFLGSGEGLFICRVSKDLKDEVLASDILKSALEGFGGSGGGRQDFAQGGLKDITKTKQVMKKVEELIKKELSK
jgi:alanyl-tRNA synthetase